MRNPSSLQLTRRTRRNRHTQAIRDLVQETRLHPSQFVAPVFVQEGTKKKDPILHFPDIFRLSVDMLLKEAESLLAHGVKTINIFCFTPNEKKDPLGLEGYRRGNLLQEVIRALKLEFPELCVMADIALDPFTDHGHDGVIDESGYVLNDPTVYALSEMGLRAAEAGCDILSPSDMMDGRVGFLRKSLDDAGFIHVGILSYAAKYATSLYGPFRHALDSAPRIGDKKNYQMNPANVREALLECALDEEEGADMLLIKPALTNLDIIAKVRASTQLPIGAYQISGEWSLLHAGASQGWLDFDRALMETLLCIKRAGADFIFTYGAKRAAQLLLK